MLNSLTTSLTAAEVATHLAASTSNRLSSVHVMLSTPPPLLVQVFSIALSMPACDLHVCRPSVPKNCLDEVPAAWQARRPRESVVTVVVCVLVAEVDVRAVLLKDVVTLDVTVLVAVAVWLVVKELVGVDVGERVIDTVPDDVTVVLPVDDLVIVPDTVAVDVLDEVSVDVTVDVALVDSDVVSVDVPVLEIDDVIVDDCVVMRQLANEPSM